MPGRPAPLPTSATVRSAAMSSFKAAQLRMCRSHRRSASRGPSSPHSTPVDCKMSTYLFRDGN